MAIGTITINYHAPEKGLIGLSFAGDGSYPTGGTAGFEASVETAIKTAAAAAADKNVRGAENITILDVVGIGNCGVYVPAWDKTNGKLMVKSEALVEVSNATNLSGTTFKVTVLYQ